MRCPLIIVSLWVLLVAAWSNAETATERNRARDAIILIQTCLTKLGYWSGPIAGIYSVKLDEAHQAYNLARFGGREGTMQLYFKFRDMEAMSKYMLEIMIDDCRDAGVDVRKLFPPKP